MRSSALVKPCRGRISAFLFSGWTVVPKCSTVVAWFGPHNWRLLAFSTRPIEVSKCVVTCRADCKSCCGSFEPVAMMPRERSSTKSQVCAVGTACWMIALHGRSTHAKMKGLAGQPCGMPRVGVIGMLGLDLTTQIRSARKEREQEELPRWWVRLP